MQFFYDLFIRSYHALVWLWAPFNPKAKKWIRGRKKSWELLSQFSNKYPDNIWVHCASVGEFEQGYPLILKLQTEFPRYKILLTFFSPSGYEFVAKRYPEFDLNYLPSDTKNNSEKWIQTLNPRAVFFVKYEFWHHYISGLKNHQIPLYMVSTLFWPELFFFKKYGGFFQKSLKNVSHFFVQNQESKTLLQQIGIQAITVHGDLRFERVLDLKNTAFQNEIIERFIAQHKVFIAGSAWNKDIEIIKKIMAVLPENFKIIIAPHEMNRFDYEQFKHENYSKYSSGGSEDAKVLFLDTLGLLSKVYRFADMVYIGGGFGSGVHNVLEPAVYNKPILIGPNNQRFAEVQLLKKAKMVQEINSQEAIGPLVENCIQTPALVLKANEHFFKQNANASSEIIVFIKKEGILL